MRPAGFVPDRHHCQHDEEAIILRIYDGLGHKKTLCDIGARLKFSNSARLIFDYGYGGNLVEPDPQAAQELRERFADYPVTVHEEPATVNNINSFAAGADFLTIDTDRNDWWLWAVITHKPRVVCIEFNHYKNGYYIAPYDENMKRGCKKLHLNYGGSELAFIVLAHNKGYDLIAKTGCNLIFALRGAANEISALQR